LKLSLILQVLQELVNEQTGCVWSGFRGSVAASASEWMSLPLVDDRSNVRDPEDWRRGSESNRRIEVLQTSALPLGYRAQKCRACTLGELIRSRKFGNSAG
jgi:hypothetical protein